MCSWLQKSGVSKLMSVVLSVLLGRGCGGHWAVGLSSPSWCVAQRFSSVESCSGLLDGHDQEYQVGISQL